MGTDKAFVMIDGAAMVARVAAALAAASADPVFAVGGDAGALASLGLVAVPDPEGGRGEGPLAGVIAALGAAAAAGSALVVVLATDLVAPDPMAIATVVDALAAEPAADVAYPVLDGRPEPLHAAWRCRSLPALRTAFAGGERSVAQVLRSLRGLAVPGLASAGLADADTPDNLPPT
jgi:molybdenum cofactor guanylyltransferase